MGHLSAEQLLQRALDLELLTERQFQEVWASVGTRHGAVEDVKKQLLRGEYMTNYQIERLAKGERSGYLLRPLTRCCTPSGEYMTTTVERLQASAPTALQVLPWGPALRRVPRRASPDGRNRRPEGLAKALLQRQAGAGRRSSSAKASWGSRCGIPTSCPSTTSPPTASRTTWSWSSSKAGTSATSSRSAPRSSRSRPRN